MSLEKILDPNRPRVPEVPNKITGPCVYGYLITDEHINHFRALYPNTKEFQIYDPESLISYASIIVSKIYIAHTLPVDDHQGKKAICLALIDYQDRGDHIDLRWSDKFIEDMKVALGIEGEPDWYPCRYKQLAFPPA